MEFSTERLTVRPFQASDGEALYAYLSDPEVVRYEPYRPFDRASALAEAARRAGDEHFLAVCLPDGTLIGNLYMEKGEFDTWEVGYVFSRACWGHGYASEAVRALIDRLFRAENAHRVIACCDQQNPRSWRLLERVGMRREAAHLQNVYFFTDEAGNPLWKDSYQYAVLKAEWRG